MLHRWKTKSTILLILFFTFSLESSDTLHYWIKSYHWDKIEEYFQNRSPSRESEVYSLIEFYDKSHIPNKGKRFLYLISQVKGSFVQEYNRNDITAILSNPLPYQSIVFRLSFWKLYLELKSRNILTLQERTKYLNKLNRDLDPISRQVTEELTRVYLDLNQSKELVSMIEGLGSDVRRYYKHREISIRYAKALARLGRLGEAKDEYIRLIRDSDTPDYLRKFAYQDLRKYLSEDAFLNLKVSEVICILNQMKSGEASHFLNNNKLYFRSRMVDEESFHQAGLFLAERADIGLLTSLVLSNKIYLNRDNDYLGEFGLVLYRNNQYSSAIEFLERFPEIKEAGKYRILTVSYNKLNNKEKTFQNLVEYLTLYPYNLYYQDMLIDRLINSNGTTRDYLPKKYWQKAISSLPNLPVKGRLFYWYLRYLKDTGDSDSLNHELKTYYEKIAGSYYTRVIREEFESELSKIPVPSNPTSNKSSLIRYLSHTAGVPELSGKILKKNLGFAYFKDSFNLGVRFTNVQTKVRGNKTLSLAMEYFSIGEDKFGMNLIHHYAKDKSLTEIQKEEIIVGVGELSRNYYFSAFYARSLLKRYRIPDDPILLPTTVSLRIYPRPHRDLVRKYSADSGITEEVVYAIMRQESFYKENAVSRSNAQGLMQIMPATGRELAQKLGVKSYTLKNPDTSIRFGSKFLGYLMRSNENELRWAAIAYNGGPGNLRKWKRNHYKGDFNHFLEDIPYKESRDYSRIVVSNYYAYDIMKKYHGL